ncbi:MAG: gliding motility-associated C-terminal domain-containing protein [Paludibacteraceae bacterium]|nr:gliding motility-associated C-terminal domain-containing protein [Paludibacteraceae bacterium]
MKKSILLLILTVFSVLSYALHVECVGKATLLTHDGDTLLVFASAPELKTLNSVGEVDWYRLPDTITPVQTGTDYFYPEHGEGYMVKVGAERDVFWVFDYEQLRPTISLIEAELDCERTMLHLEGELPKISYTRLSGKQMTYPRNCHVEYMSAAWSEDTEMWVDSVAIEELTLEQEMTVSASPVATDYAISDMLAEQLGVAADTLRSPVYQPVALKAHPVTITTTRGKQGEMSNEVNRPYSPDDVLNMSAPLEVLFKANGLNAEYYQWKLYKGSSLMLTRSDAEHRYTFTDKGNYRAVVAISNSNCQLDSVEFTISISESMVVVPNVFTPNGDGTNDEFRVVYRSLKEFHCWVYNRWGHLVYEWSDPAKGWDGTIGGRPAVEGAYFYVIRALGTDADENAKYTIKPVYNSKLKKQDEALIGVYQLSGSINLLRGGK